MAEFKIETRPGQNPGARIVRITGPLTLQTLFDFQRALRDELAAVTIVDLSAVPYLDSAALGSLLGLHVSCERHGRRYGLAQVPQRLKDIFQVTHVDKILVCFPTVEEAEKSMEAFVATGN